MDVYIHVAHIEQACLFSGPFVAFNMAEIGVLQGHVKPRKGHHFRAPGEM